MRHVKPITWEYIRRFTALMMLALFAGLYFYFPPNIYEIQIKEYSELYRIKLERGIIAPDTTLEAYIDKQIQGNSFFGKKKKKSVAKAEGVVAELLEKITHSYANENANDPMTRHHKNEFMTKEHYFFNLQELPKALIENTVDKETHDIVLNTASGKSVYFKIYQASSAFDLQDAPTWIRYPLRNTAYGIILLTLLVYLLIPRGKAPQGAAYFARLNAVYLPDILIFLLWIAGWMLFFLPDDSAPVVVRYIMLGFFGVFSLALVMPVNRYASNWYLFREGTFEWSDANGIQSVALSDIVSVQPYTKSLPKWVAPLIILLGKGQPGPTGIGMLTATSSSEMGMDMMTKDGRKIRIMANYLRSDESFTKQFQALEKKLHMQ